MSNPIVQWQILTPDPAAAESFYGQLFDWSISSDNPMGYREVAAAEGGIPGGIWQAPPEATPFVQLFVQVDDVEATVSKCEEMGGSVLVPVQQLPGGQKMSILRDPSGMSFGVTSSS